MLKDVNKQDRVIDWKGKKEASILLSNCYSRLGLQFQRKSERVAECGDFLQFKRYTETEKLKLLKGNFCKVRLCPMCSWRRSLKIYGQVSQVMDHLEENHNFRYLFLTLTVENPYKEEFNDTLDLMTKAFSKMTRRKAFKGAVKGYFRALEVTFNKKDNSFHPHFHIILAVEPSYFNDRNHKKVYLSQKDWTNLWKDCLQVDYNPIVDIRAVRKNNKKEISEVAKYTVKSDDFLIKDDNGEINEELTDMVVETLDIGLARRRLVAFGFIFKEIHQKLKLDDAIDGELENTHQEDEEIEGLNYVIENYLFDKSQRNYFKVN